jgi:hypothetical protein
MKHIFQKKATIQDASKNNWLLTKSFRGMDWVVKNDFAHCNK